MSAWSVWSVLLMMVACGVGQAEKGEAQKPPAAAAKPAETIPPEILEYFEREKSETVKRREEIETKIEDLDAKWKVEKDPEAKIENRKKRAGLQRNLNQLEYRDAKPRPDLTKVGSVGWLPYAEVPGFVNNTTAVMMGIETDYDVYVLQGTSIDEIRPGKRPQFSHPWQVVEIRQRTRRSDVWEKALNTRWLTPNSGFFCVLKPVSTRDLARYRDLARQSEQP